MDNTFRVEIYTPDRHFMSEDIESLVCNCVDGEICVLRGHTPMIMAIDIGCIKIKQNGEWKTAVCDAGFGEVKNNIVRLFVGEVEWMQNLEQAKAEILRLREDEKTREIESLRVHRENTIALVRTIAELNKKKKINQ